VFKDLLHEAMTLITWCYVIKGPNLHVAQAHFKRNLMILQVVIYKIDHLVTQLFKKPISLTIREFS